MKAVIAIALAVMAVAPPVGTEDPTIRPDARAVLMVGIQGTSLDPGSLFHLRDGGRSVVLLGPNVTTAPELRQVARDMACATGGNYLLAVDHEPLRVQRLASIVGPFPRLETDDEMRVFAGELGADLNRVGVTVDLAPVLDLSGGSSPALVGRTFSDEPGVVTALGESFRRGIESERVAAVIKHFPGHGRASLDPHLAVTSIDGPTAEELAPFLAAVSAGARAVMVGHPIYTDLDPATPASSAPATYELLRSWGFDGVAVTDALGMVGARAGRTIEETAVAALSAGADLLIIEDHAARESTVDAIVAAIGAGSLDRSRLAEAAHRVRRLASWTAGYTTECREAWTRQ